MDGYTNSFRGSLWGPSTHVYPTFVGFNSNIFRSHTHNSIHIHNRQTLYPFALAPMARLSIIATLLLVGLSLCAGTMQAAMLCA